MKDMRISRYTLNQLCEELAISTATGRNWIKLKKIEPEYIDGKPVFSEDYVTKLKAQLYSDTSNVLKSRRNKKYISGQELYDGYISETSVNRDVIKKIVSKFIESCHACESKYLISYYGWQLCVDIEMNADVCTELISSMSGDMSAVVQFAEDNPWVADYRLVYEDGEDILGLLYISCKQLEERKASGAYYTPNWVVKELVSQMWEQKGAIDYKLRKILDPSCGTGNFLLQLPEHIGLSQIYGADIDEDSVKITRINLALKYQPESVELLYRNIQCVDFLVDYDGTDFDYIIGNPPWGYDFTGVEKSCMKKTYRTARNKQVESYDVFVERSLEILRTDGKLAFVLPEAILSVRAHTAVRELICQMSAVKTVVYLGDIFHKVQCPSVILMLEKGLKQICSIQVKTKKEVYSVAPMDRLKSSGFQLAMSDDEYMLMQKIYSCDNSTTLSGKAIFAMGIVTGNNSKYISEMPDIDKEPIIKGKDVEKYSIEDNRQYIQYAPDELQQVASEEVYRAKEKLVYRFIGDRLCFAYDDRGRLTLNSCNILIPHIEGLHMKYIMAVLNSSVADFVYRNRFKSVKVLRSHIEAIPIPRINQNAQMEIVKIVDKLETLFDKNDYGRMNEFQKMYAKLDKYIVSIFGLNDAEYDLIRRK